MSFGSREKTSPFGIVTIFNQYFHSIFRNEVSTSSLDSHLSKESFLSDFDITIHDVFHSLSRLDVSKASGIDSIPNYVLKLCSTSLCKPVHYLFNQCYQQSYLPVEWRAHTIIPIHKSGDKSSVFNYCPISLLCCISKVLEYIICTKLYEYISGLISVNQFGFMRGRSTVQQLLLLLHSVSEAISNKQKFILTSRKHLTPSRTVVYFLN